MGVKKETLCEIYSRIVGYMRPLKSWNIAKKDEFQKRAQLKLSVKKEGDNGTRIND